MQTTPNLGLTYPDPADHTRTWEYWRDMALRLDKVAGMGGIVHRNGDYTPTNNWLPVQVNTEVTLKGVTFNAVQYSMAVPDQGFYIVIAQLRARGNAGARFGFRAQTSSNTLTGSNGSYYISVNGETLAPVAFLAGYVPAGTKFWAEVQGDQITVEAAQVCVLRLW